MRTRHVIQPRKSVKIIIKENSCLTNMKLKRKDSEDGRELRRGGRINR